MYQGKTAVVLLCIAVFLQAYFGDLRTVLAAKDEALGVGELFLAITNNNYTSFTIWTGFILLISDLPNMDKSVFPFLLRSNKLSWLKGQIMYLMCITMIYYFYLILLVILLLVPHISFSADWTTVIFKMINAPLSYGVRGRFVLPVSVLRNQKAVLLFLKGSVLFVLAGFSMGMITMTLNLLWNRGPGILAGGLELVFDFWVTTVMYNHQEMIYVSPLSMARIGNISGSQWNEMLPTFSYAVMFHCILIIVSYTIQILNIRRMEL